MQCWLDDAIEKKIDIALKVEIRLKMFNGEEILILGVRYVS